MIKTKSLSSQEEMVCRHYLERTAAEVAEMTGLSIDMVYHFAYKNGLTKNKRWTYQRAEKYLHILKPLELKLTLGEISMFIKEKHDIQLTPVQLTRIFEILELKQFIGSGMSRKFIDGDKDNTDPENIVLISKDVYRKIRNYELINGKLTGQPLITFIELAKMKICIEEINENFYYKAINRNSGEVVTDTKVYRLLDRLELPGTSYRRARFIGENGGVLLKNRLWEVVKIIKETV